MHFLASTDGANFYPSDGGKFSAAHSPTKAIDQPTNLHERGPIAGDASIVGAGGPAMNPAMIAEVVRHHKERWAKSLKRGIKCKFCENNKEPEWFYTTHTTHDATGKVTCPKLRAITCQICHSTGDDVCCFVALLALFWIKDFSLG